MTCQLTRNMLQWLDTSIRGIQTSYESTIILLRALDELQVFCSSLAFLNNFCIPTKFELHGNLMSRWLKVYLVVLTDLTKVFSKLRIDFQVCIPYLVFDFIFRRGFETLQ